MNRDKFCGVTVIERGRRVVRAMIIARTLRDHRRRLGRWGPATWGILLCCPCCAVRGVLLPPARDRMGCMTVTVVWVGWHWSVGPPGSSGVQIRLVACSHGLGACGGIVLVDEPLDGLEQ